MTATSPNAFWLVAAFFFVLGSTLIGLSRWWPERAPRAPAALALGGTETAEPETGPVAPALAAAAAPEITWPALIAPDAPLPDPSARALIVEALGTLGDDDARRVLRRAYDEERGALRDSVVAALAAAGDEPALRRAYGELAPLGRLRAVDAATAHGRVALLADALGDGDEHVALAAALGLARAGRPDLVEARFAGRDDDGARETRRVLALLDAA